LLVHGIWLSCAIGIAFLIVGFLGMFFGMGWVAVAVGALVGIVATVLFLSYVEVLKIIADTLLPK
jgi:hypothetical protein